MRAGAQMLAQMLAQTLAQTLALLLALAGPAGAAGGGPWSVAVVAESGSAMQAAWRGSTRREAALEALGLELATLPLRVRAGLWLAAPGGVRRLVAPAPSLELKGLDLYWPPAGGPARLGPALERAAAWLADQGGGSLLLLAASPPPPGWRPPEGVFCHVLALDAPAGGQGLAGLAARGGGALFAAERPGRVLPLLHRAVLTALSPARLLVVAHDAANRPLDISYRLGRHRSLARALGGPAGRTRQLLPAVYRLLWPAGAAIGPAPPPERVSVAPEGLTRVWAGGVGRLAVSGVDEKGRPLDWSLRVVRLEDGSIVEEGRRPPLKLELAAGRYLVKALQRPLAWEVELAAGGETAFTAGPQATLLAGLLGPEGPLRAPYQLWDLLAHRPAGTGYTNQPLTLKPGPYRLRLSVPPGPSREIVLRPAQRRVVELPAAGGLLVPRRPGLRGFTVLDARGRPLEDGTPGRVLPLMPGGYRVRLDGRRGQVLAVEIAAGELATVEPGSGSR